MSIVKNRLTLLMLSVTISAAAQKLPSVQMESVPAPKSIKIDGKTTEWDDKLHAYNNHVEFAYTLANDDKNLYLVVQVDKRDIVRRIMNGGVSLVVNKTGKKSDKDGMSVTFPLFESTNRFTPRYVAGGNAVVKSIGGGGGGTFNMYGNPVGGGGSPANTVVAVSSVRMDGGGPGSKPLTADQADSLMKANNTNFNNKAKNIGLKGFKDLDSLISVYNEDGIKVAGAFDAKGVYTYEMAIPLKYFGLDAASAAKFTYHMLINAVEQKGVNIVNGTGVNGESKIMSINITAGAQMGQDATDFWGEYTLAQK